MAAQYEDDDPEGMADYLEGYYGRQPDEEFIREWFDWLRFTWLAGDRTSRQRVTAALGGPLEGNQEAQLDFLAAKSNAKRIRSILLSEFLTVADPSEDHEFFDENMIIDYAPPGSPPPTRVSLSPQDLERRLWDAANALRGPVDPADFKTYVFPMLFWKWISDTWDWEHAKAVADYGDDVDPEVEADYHKFELPLGTHWRDVTTKTANLGAAINKALGQIEQANPDSLAGMFGDASWGNKERLPEASLVNLINAFNGMTLNPDEVSNDLLGQGYEYLLKKFADESGKKAGEFFTPRQVVRLLIRILDPQPGESVYDPACGSGGMLVETINTVRDDGGDTRTLRLYGQEVNLTTSAIARMNLYLHDIEDFKIVRGDTLRSPGLRKPDGKISTFDVVVANPPFSLANWGAETWAADVRSLGGVPPAKNGDFAWIQHMIASMDPEAGRVGVVMPHGVLFRGGAEAKIRQALIEADQLEAVIGLPGNLFYSTTIPACLLIFRADKPEARRGHVLFVDGSARFTKGRNQNQMSPEDVQTILDGYETGDDPDGKGGLQIRLVPMSDIETNGWDLNIGRYITTSTDDDLDLDAALAVYQQARQNRLATESSLFARLAAAGIADIGGADG
jgi:type I restriction enzyme M protein